MHIFIDNGTTPLPELDLPQDFDIELSRTNPFLTEEGSQSIPLTIPCTANNMRLLGWSYRPNSTTRPFQRVPALLVDRTLMIQGEIVSTEAHPIDGVSASFYFREGKLYEKIKDKKLGDIPWPRYEGPNESVEENAKYWMNVFLDSMNNQTADQDYYIFSVITDEVHFYAYPFSDHYGEAKDDFKLILNKFVCYDKEVYFYAETIQEYFDDTVYTLPIGYGVTPFLRLRYILIRLFDYIGYTFDTTYFDRDISLSRLCLLNNTADTITAGFLDYNQLIPTETTIEDFLDLIQKNLGIRFVEDAETIRMIYWRELMPSQPDLDLSVYIRDFPTFSKEEPKSIHIKYEPTYDVSDILYTKETLERIADKDIEEIDLSTKNKLCFNYSAFLYTFWVVNEDEDYLVDWLLSAPRINGIKNENTELINEENESTEEKNSNLDIMLCFSIPEKQKIFYPTLEGTDPGAHVPGEQQRTQEYWYWGGTIHSYDYLKETWGSFSLVANSITADINPTTQDNDNIFNSFYQELEQFYRHANQKLTYQALLPAHIISSMDITKPKIINGQKVLIERIDYVLGYTELCQITAKTMHTYED